MKKSKKYLYKEVRWIPIYGRCYKIIVSNSKKKARKLEPILAEGSFYASVHNGKKMPVIFFNFDSDTPITHGVVAHEALHLTNRIADVTGLRYDLHNDESFCYLLDYIVDDLNVFFKKHKLKPKNYLNG